MRLRKRALTDLIIVVAFAAICERPYQPVLGVLALDGRGGAARDNTCVDCGEAAEDWSYNGLDSDEVMGPTPAGRIVAYSVNPESYEPRCRRCHFHYDMAAWGVDSQTGMLSVELTPGAVPLWRNATLHAA
jgi:hypothetical protein